MLFLFEYCVYKKYMCDFYSRNIEGDGRGDHSTPFPYLREPLYSSCANFISKSARIVVVSILEFTQYMVVHVLLVATFMGYSLPL